jgi:hypothetical protein
MPYPVTQHTDTTTAFFYSEYTSTCNFKNATTKSTAFPIPFIHKTPKCSAAYVQIPYTEMYTNQTLNMESTDKNSICSLQLSLASTAPLCMTLIILWHFVKISYTEFNPDRYINTESASRNLFVL